MRTQGEGGSKYDQILRTSFMDGPLVTVTKIKQESTNQDRTKIGLFFEFLLHFSIFLLEICSIASQLCNFLHSFSNCENEKVGTMKYSGLLV